MSLFDLKLSEIHNKLHDKELSVSDLVDQAFTSIGEREDRVKAFITLDEEGARSAAKALDSKLASGETAVYCLAFLPASRITLLRRDCGQPVQVNSCPISIRCMMRRLSASCVRRIS